MQTHRNTNLRRGYSRLSRVGHRYAAEALLREGFHRENERVKATRQSSTFGGKTSARRCLSLHIPCPHSAEQIVPLSLARIPRCGPLASAMATSARWQDILLLLEHEAVRHLYLEFVKIEETEDRGLTKAEFADACLRHITNSQPDIDKGGSQDCCFLLCSVKGQHMIATNYRHLSHAIYQHTR